MGEITDITLQKNKNRANLFVDGEFFCGLMKETLVANNLKVGQIIDEVKLKNIISESEVRRAFNYCLDLVGKKLYSKKELVDKMKNKGFGEFVFDKVLNKLEEYNLIDDLGYAKAIINNSRLDGRKKIEQKLFAKGIDKEIIKNATNDIKSDDESAKIEVISAKYMKNKEKTAQNLQKLYRYLVGRGFDYNLISEYISKFKGEDDESWD